MKVLLAFGILLLISLATTLPVNPAWSPLRPQWLVLLTIFMCIYHSDNVSLLLVTLLGLLIDFLYLSPLGVHALPLVVVAYITLKFHRKMKSFSIFRQMLWVFVLTLIFVLVSGWLKSVFYNYHFDNLIVLSIISSAIVWPMTMVLIKSPYFASTE